MKVNLGSGSRRMEGWVNVDLYHDADVKADIREVTFPVGSVAHVICVHTIEHLTREDGVALIGRAAEWLEPGGILEIETPDFEKCKHLIKDGAAFVGAKGILGGRSVDKIGWHSWIKQWVRTVKQVDREFRKPPIPQEFILPGEQHLYVWTAAELLEVMSAAGLRANVAPVAWHGGRNHRDSRVVGVKP